jgi:enoyl-CoA hydratase
MVADMPSESVPLESVTVERRDALAIIHLDDGRVNAMTFEVIAAISHAVIAADADPTVRAVVLHGRPGRFSAGFDLSVMQGTEPQPVRDLVADGGDLAHLIYGCGVPVVAACTGHSIAMGALLLLSCDVRVGPAIDAKVGLNEVAIGMTLPDWAITLAVDRLSRRHLQRAVANGRLTSPAEALHAGFLDEVVPADEVLDRAVELAAELAATVHPKAYAATVKAMRGDVLARMAAESAEFRSTGKV